MSDMIYERKIYKEIKPFMSTNDVIVIHGARQTGKTTLLKRMMKDLPPEDTCYFDLEESELLELCDEGVGSIVDYLRQRGLLRDQKKFYLLIDEIQYLANPSSLMKLIYDHHPYLKLIVSGSSSFGMKKKFKDSLVGRTVDFELYPLDFEEFLLFKNQSFDLSKRITSEVLVDELKRLYKEYVIYGGYPKIVLTDAVKMKDKYLRQIIDTYIKKDIRDLAQVRNITKFNKLLRVLASQCGQMLNITELSNIAQLAKQTVEEYLLILEDTYVIKLLPPFSRNVRSELFKTPKVFFYDTGLLHMLWLKTFPEEFTGNVFEVSIFSEFVKNIDPESIYYWRTQDKKEIDFIITEKLKMTPVEVKLNASRLNYTAMKYFVSHYQPGNAFCISLEGELPTGEFKSRVTPIKPWEYGLYR
jgi:predicted AAA+ superfamily ATPase